MQLRCRCGDIRRVEADIATMNRIGFRVNSIAGRNNDKRIQLGRLAASVENTLSPAHLPSLMTEIRNLNQDIRLSTGDIRATVRSAITSLENERSRLRSLDRQFHAQQQNQKGGCHQ